MNELPADKVIIMNGFSDQEIVQIMRAVKGLYAQPHDLIFATTTPNSIRMVLGEVIADMAADHAYLRDNPPSRGNIPSGPAAKVD